MGKGRVRAGLAAVAVVAAGVIPVLGGGTAGNAAVGSPVFPDFDHDGKADVVVSMDQEDIGSAVDAGAIGVFYGGPVGPFQAGFERDQFFSNATPGFVNDAETNGRFGDWWAAGDYNSDGFDDLAINNFGATVQWSNAGTPTSSAGAGMVHVIYGGVNGLAVGNGYQAIDLDSTGVADNPGVQDQFGHSVASGDLNGDGNDDLVVGVPRRNLNGANNGGAVYLFPGSATGIDTANDKRLNQGSAGQGDQSDDNDIFGDAVTTGDFDNDGNDDIAIGAPEETLNDLLPPPPDPISKSGMFHVVYGDSTFANIGTNFDVFTEESGGALSGALANSRLGCDMVAGNFNGDAYTDLAVCADGRRVGTINNAGSVYVLKGSAAGITTAGSQIWNFASAGVRGDAFGGDNFGDSIAAGDYNNDGRDDLAIAVDKREISGSAGIDHGLFIVLPGSSAAGLFVNGGKYKGFSEATKGIASNPANGDEFASLLRSGDYNGDGFTDLYVAAAGETVSGQSKAGGVFLMKGRTGGLTSSGSKLYTQDSSKIADQSEANDFFGGS